MQFTSKKILKIFKFHICKKKQKKKKKEYKLFRISLLTFCVAEFNQNGSDLLSEP